MVMNNQSLFEQALQRIKNGEEFQIVVKDYPQDVRDMLLIIRKMDMFKAHKPLDLQKQKNHKRKFLKQAQHDANISHYPFKVLVPRLILILLMIVVPLTFTGLASVQAIPGDVLYGVKRTVEQVQLNLTSDSSGKIRLEELFDTRRVWEVKQMQEAQRWDAVQIAGWLEIQPKGNWMIDDMVIILESIEAEQLKSLNGILGPDGVEAENIQLRLFNLSGELTASDDGEWLIDGTKVEITPETRIRGPLTSGGNAEITAIHVYQERFVALLVVITGEDKNRQLSPLSPTPN